MTETLGDRAARRAGGVFYTPPGLARFLVRQTVSRVWTEDAIREGRGPRILDPACGDGVFLRAAYEALAERYLALARHDPDWRLPGQQGCSGQPDALGRWQLSPELRLWILRHHLFGLDVDSAAVDQAIDSLVRVVIPPTVAKVVPDGWSTVRRLVADNVRHGNALIGDLPRPHSSATQSNALDGLAPESVAPDSVFSTPASPVKDHGGASAPLRDAMAIPSFDWQREFSQVFRGPSPGFDLVIGNPPYVNARLLTRSAGPAVKQYLRRHYDCAVGSFDLYVLFLERAYHLLREGGVCGMIVPNKVATADYARPVRRLLLRHTRLEQIVDLASVDAFPGTGIYPYILVWTRQPPPRSHEVTIRELVASPHAPDCELADGDPSDSVPSDSVPSDANPDGGSTRRVPQSSLNAEAGFQLHASLDVESRCVTEPLSAVADLRSGTTGFTASALAQRLCERSETPADSADEGFDFIVSGNIDRYAIRAGNVQFMGRRFQRPYLPCHDQVLSEAKQQLFAGAKIVVAGLTRRIEAAWDTGGLALGVQVYAVLPRVDDAHYLLALLNSKLLTYLFLIRFPAKRLGGGYHSINKGQLGRLPIRRIDHNQPDQRAAHDRLINLARRLEQQFMLPGDADDAADRARVTQTLEQELDQQVYALYGVSSLEKSRIEACFADYFASRRHPL